MAKASKTKPKPHTEGSHDSANTANSPGGGAVAIRGFLIQTFAALAQVFNGNVPFSEITLEPLKTEEGQVDKFDFLWTDTAEGRYAVQVKSSENGFARSTVTKWVEEMLTQRTLEKCTLILAGHASDKGPTKLRDEEEISTVKICFITPNLNELTKIICHDLSAFLQDESFNKSSAKDRLDLVERLITQMLLASTKSVTIKRDEWMEKLRVWSNTPLPRDAEESPPALSEVYSHTIQQIEDVLNQCESVSDFIGRFTSGLISQHGQDWALNESSKPGQLDVCPHLKRIVDNLGKFRPRQSGDWIRLGDVAGGLVVLAIDPAWVLSQRDLARNASASFPADAESIGLGQERMANLLHLVSCALADGCARLERVFGKPPLDKYQIPSNAQLARSIGKEGHLKEIKIHFIRYILPDEQFVESDDAKIQLLFNRVKRIFTVALEDDHTAYSASGDHYKDLTKSIRDHLKVQDLLLINPSGEDPELLLRDYVRVLSFLSKIFEAVRAHHS